MGLHLIQDIDRNKPCIVKCIPSTPAAKMTQWRSRIKHSYILQIDNTPVNTIEDVKRLISDARKMNKLNITLTLTHDELRNAMSSEGIPQLYFDQLNIIQQYLDAIRLFPKEGTILKCIRSTKLHPLTLQGLNF